MPMDLLLAVDGGQSQTLALLATLEGRILGTGLSGPANHIHEPGGMERINRALREAIGGAFEQAGLPLERVHSACFGMTGGAEVVGEVVAAFLQCDTLTAVEDSVTALAGASLAQPGVVVIAGTGAVAFGQTVDGRQAKSGGWGHIMGDEGSAYDIGIQTLRATTLTVAVPAYLGAADLAEVRQQVYASIITRPQIAGLAAVVSQAANMGDDLARRLLAEAGRSLAQQALAVLRRLGMLETGMSVYTTGGVFGAGEWIGVPFRAAVNGASPRAEVRAAAFAPVIGALLLARQQAGQPITQDTIDKIQATLPAVARSKSS
jgi:N-acetylglucosamine kinase-like BadF-type ATPase